MRADITGLSYGRWTVLSSLRPKGARRRSIWRCRCQCGTEKAVMGENLRQGRSKSCGCLSSEQTSRRNFKHGHARTSRRTPEYRAWIGMIKRCKYELEDSFKYYGGCGITVCERWQGDFSSFLKDMGPRPSRLHSIDRIDNSLGYYPTNCRWATKTQQMQNMRRNRLLEHEGLALCVAGWARCTGIGATTICWRLDNGWSIERALRELPVRSRHAVKSPGPSNL